MNKVGLSLALLSVIAGNSQDYCSTTSNSEYLELVFETYKDLDVTTHKLCVKIYIHVIRRDNGTGGQSIANIDEALGYLEDAFNPHDIYFWWDNKINYIDNTTHFNHPPTIMSIDTYDNDDGVDIYLFDDNYAHPVTGNGIGLASGIGIDPAKFLVGGSWNSGLINMPLVRSHVLSHEMGHVLYLWHTHHGTVAETGDPNQCAECVSGYNSTYCGDYINNTPADPNINYNVDVNCSWLGLGYDNCVSPFQGNAYTPDELNIMSYTDPFCMAYFSPGQGVRMKKALMVIPHLQNLSNHSTTGIICPDSGFPLRFYPNPIDDKLYLDLKEKRNNIYQYEIYDMYGIRKISGQTFNEIKEINVSELDSGIYFLFFYDSAEVIIKTVLKK